MGDEATSSSTGHLAERGAAPISGQAVGRQLHPQQLIPLPCRH